MVAVWNATQHPDRLTAAELATRPSTTLADTSTDVETPPLACVRESLWVPAAPIVFCIRFSLWFQDRS